MSLIVADLSNHQTPKLANYPADLYIFKATEGQGGQTYSVDKNCDKYVQQAKKAGKPYGVYHFMDQSPWENQAKWFLKNIKGYIGEAVLFLDYESYGRIGTDKALKWLQYVERETGIKPLMYMSASVTHEENWSQVVKNGNGLWVADYTPPLDKVGYWPSVALWQYTSKPYDKSYFYGDVKAWQAYAKGKSVAKPKEQPIKQGIDKPIKGLWYRSHLSKIGWLGFVGTECTSGTTGKALPLEAIDARWDGQADKISASFQDLKGKWYDWTYGVTGTTGKALPLQMVRFDLGIDVRKTGRQLQYRVHSATVGWSKWVNEGETVGTEGKQIEAVEMRMMKDGKVEIHG